MLRDTESRQRIEVTAVVDCDTRVHRGDRKINVLGSTTTPKHE